MRSSKTSSSNDRTWLNQAVSTLPDYLRTLESQSQPGRFYPCLEGATEVGRSIQLGFSCFALKIFYTIGIWETLPESKRNEWTFFINSFQANEKGEKGVISENAFIDPVMLRNAHAQVPYPLRLARRLFPSKGLTHPQRVILAETKQALSTLAMVGKKSLRPYGGFPATPEEIKSHLRSLDWTMPWGAGGQASALVVFVKTQAPELINDSEVNELLRTCEDFFSGIVDPETGGYYAGSCPAFGQTINGAMKVLTALDWLQVPVHYPEKLIDTCLERMPTSDGCHLVDAVYVLYRCSTETDYKKDEIKDYCILILEMIRKHYNEDGGFSFFIGRSQTHYYNRQPISKGLAESDLHGTCLFTWAISMIERILKDDSLGWNIMKP